MKRLIHRVEHPDTDEGPYRYINTEAYFLGYHVGEMWPGPCELGWEVMEGYDFFGFLSALHLKIWFGYYKEDIDMLVKNNFVVRTFHTKLVEFDEDSGQCMFARRGLKHEKEFPIYEYLR